jgi:hypothetical protein
MNYSRFLHGLELADVDLNRKMLSEIAIADPAAFGCKAVATEQVESQPAKQDGDINPNSCSEPAVKKLIHKPGL